MITLAIAAVPTLILSAVVVYAALRQLVGVVRDLRGPLP